MRILLVTYWPLPHTGGVWTFMRQLTSCLTKHGHQVDIMAQSPDTTGFHLLYQNRCINKYEFLPLLQGKLDAANFPQLHENPSIYWAELDRYCMELAAAYFGLEHYDVIHAQDVIAARAISRVKPKETPLLVNIHGSLSKEIKLMLNQQNPDLTGQEIDHTFIENYYRTIEQYGVLSSDIVLTTSQWLRNIIIKDFGTAPEKIITFQYGIDIESFLNKSQLTDSPVVRPTHKKVIICTSRLVHLKGIHYLLAALFKLKQERDDWICWIVGDGDRKDDLYQQCLHFGLHEKVEFMGNRQDIPYLLNLSDIFILPSLQDNQPFSLIEAQVFGKPAVVSDAGGLPEMVKHGHTGFICPAGQSDPLYLHLKMLLENEEYRKLIGFNAKEWAVNHWSSDKMAQRMLSVYENAIKTN